MANEFGDRVQVLRKDLLQDLDLAADFDLVWSFGVLHHTGDTYTAFRNIARCVPRETLKAGDQLLFGKYTSQEVGLDGQDYLILRDDEVLAVVGSPETKKKK